VAQNAEVDLLVRIFFFNSNKVHIYRYFAKFDLNKVLGLPGFEMQSKFISYYFSILDMFLIQTDTFSVFLVRENAFAVQLI